MIVYTASEIATRFNVTQEQIDRASRILDCQTGKVFYQVESQTTSDVIYAVRWNSQYRRLTCECKAAERGIGCWHKRAASAAAFEYRQCENLQARKEAEEAAAASQARAYASDKDWQAQERAANRVPVRGYEASKFEVAPSGNRVPMR